MNQYQSTNTFEYYLEDKKDDNGPSKGSNHNQIVFRKLTIENYVYETIMLPIQEIFAQTSLKFLNRYLMSSTPQYCQLQDQISLLHKVYFLQGVSMQKFITNLFERIDSDQHGITNQLYMINGNFQEALSELLQRSLSNLNKRAVMGSMNVNFEETRKAPAGERAAADCLYSIKVDYNCEWPVEIVIDKLTIARKYNRVFKLLV